MSTDTIPLINLLPWREARQLRRRQRFLLSLGGAATVTLLIVVGAVALAKALVSGHEHRNTVLGAETASLKQRINELDAADDRYRQQHSQDARIRNLHAARLKQTRMLAAIPATISRGLLLTELRFAPPFVQLQGSAKTARHVSQWLRLLEARADVISAELQAIYLQQSATAATAQTYVYHIDLQLQATETGFAPTAEDQ